MDKIIVFFNAHLKSVISGGDERALQMLKRWSCSQMTNISIFTDSFISNELKNRSIKTDILYTIFYKEKFGPIVEYFMRIFKAIKILKQEDNNSSICYSVSSFLPDVYPSMWCKKHFNNVKWYGLIHHVIKDYKNRPGNIIWNYIAWLEQ